MSGASGAVYGGRLLSRLLERGDEVHFVVSEAGARVIREELGADVDPARPDPAALLAPALRAKARKRVVSYDARDIGAAIASGSFETAGMAIVPCSAGKACAIAAGLSTNLIERAAAVALKERRRLVLAVRETPLSTIHLEALARLSAAGAIVLPASPGFYRKPEGVMDLVDFVVERILAQFPE